MDFDWQELKILLNRSDFRSSFSLSEKEKTYIKRKGLDAINQHAHDFIEHRIAPVNPANDGKQTPFKNHPVFIAQHATATCCRGCIAKWHDIEKGKALNYAEKEYLVRVIMAWIKEQYDME